MTLGRQEDGPFVVYLADLAAIEELLELLFETGHSLRLLLELKLVLMQGVV